jgi:Pyruvate/2-oxoacid:ferredoxin oxidoreductase gamma subunit
MTERFRYLDRQTLPFPFCPGCGHGVILPRIDEALSRIDADPAKVVIVTDIGCVGLSDQYFKTHAFHGLHGRSITYATGIKLADPDLHVLVLMGDGGMGIGGAHLLAAARRNIGITVLVFNNANFGMTGGQHSAATPEGARTGTTPGGNLEMPLDVCATLAPSRPNLLARTHAYDPKLPELIAEGLTCKGFALIDIQEYCTAYFVPGNLFEEDGLLALPDVPSAAEGVVARNNREEFSRAYRDLYHRPLSEKNPRPGLDVCFTHRLSRKTGILLAGGAGQKIKSTAALLGQAALLSGLYATQKDDYPITIMTGYSVSEVLLSPDPIDYTGIEVPDVLILLSEEGLKKTRRLIPRMTAGSWICADSALDLPPTGASILQRPFKETASAIDPSSVALVALGGLIAQTGIVPREALERAIDETRSGERADKGHRALWAGFSLVSGEAGPPEASH